MSGQQQRVGGNGGAFADPCLTEAWLRHHLCQYASLPTDGANCGDTIIHVPRMTLGSYVKGLNNIICRVWAWKAGPWSLGSGLIVVFMEVHMRVDLAWLAKLFFSATYGVFVLGLHPRSLVFFLLSPFLEPFPLGGSPSPLVLLPFYTSSYFPFNVHL